MKFFDTHAHISDKRFGKDRAELVEQKLPSAGVELIVDVGCDLRNVDTTVKLINKYQYVYGAFGMHPHYADAMNMDMLNELEELLKNDKAVALGEIGLDYHYDFSARDAQKKWFDIQLSLAEQLNLPVSLHIREAFGDCMDILRAHRRTLAANGGVMHCFSGSRETAFECLDLGLYLGIGGSLTFQNAKKLVEVVRDVPMEAIVTETDCPYLTPVPFRGERNDPSFLVYVANKIAEIRGMTTDEVAKATFNNGCRLFRMGN